MKRTTKRILPILLAIAIIASSAWYLLVYDVEFTRDALLYHARQLQNHGKHTAAAWLYDLAYVQSGGDASVAIELADQFKENGNYTKAEVTLSNAIANGGTAELYIALCKTYVEQNKLLDAVTMLDNIADPAIKEQIYAMRPAAPAATPEGGFYNQNVNVTITWDTGTLLVTTNGEYPSTEDTPSDGNLTLSGGETIVYALSIADNGLVSPLTIVGYTISGVIEEVTIEDPTIDALVREQLGFREKDQLYSNNLWQITQLILPEGAESYADLAKMPYLQSLTIVKSAGADLNVLSSLRYLTELVIVDSSVKTSDLLTIAAIPNLQNLTLRNCGISSIENLQNAKHLQYLDLSNNSIRDFTALSFMTTLNYLNLSHNALTSLNALSSLSALQYLDVSYNSLSSIAPVAGCVQLQTLNVDNNFILSLNGVSGLGNLTQLNAASNLLTEINALNSCTAMQYLDISGNYLTDISPLASMNGLIELNFARNQVTAIPKWDPSCALVTIDGSNNMITLLGVLAGFENLNYVYMDYNNISSVNSLATCHNLVKVSVYGNPVKDVSALTDMSVIVNYNPLG